MCKGFLWLYRIPSASSGPPGDCAWYLDQQKAEKAGLWLLDAPATSLYQYLFMCIWWFKSIGTKFLWQYQFRILFLHHWGFVMWRMMLAIDSTIYMHASWMPVSMGCHRLEGGCLWCSTFISACFFPKSLFELLLIIHPPFSTISGIYHNRGCD